MEIWQAIILGLVEGITEYLPISSTGHLIIAGELMGLKSPASKATLDTFDIAIQGGAILAVVGLYFPRFMQMLHGVIFKDKRGIKLLVNLIIAFLPSAMLGLVLKDWITEHLFSLWPVVGALAVGGVYMILVDGKFKAGQPKGDQAPASSAVSGAAAVSSEGGGGAFVAGGVNASASPAAIQRRFREIDDVTPAQALLIGIMQCAALWPGVSRSMMTITGGLFAGLRPAAAAEFSFLLGVPTLTAAAGYALLKDFKRAAKDGTPNMFEAIGIGPIAVGFLVAAVSAAIAVRFLVGVLKKRGLAPFGVYRIVAALVLAGLALAGWVAVGK